MAVDLHLHTTHSDGSFAPKDLVDLVRHYNVDVMAVTDHDDISGVQEAQARGKEVGVRVIAGIELSIDYPLQGRAHLHLLGLMLDIENPDLLARLHYLREARRARAKEIVERLQKMNIDVHYDELEQIVSGESIGRPHIAHLLVKKGVVTQVSEAFEKYLGRNAPAFVAKKKMTLAEAIDLVHKAKGLAILAHPISLFAKNFDELARYLDHFRELGLDGLEAYYSYHPAELTRFLLDYAKKNRMAVSGGSDFHGEAKPDIKPAIGTGNLHIPPEIVPALIEFRKEKYGE
jgi:predicted metal-dependent phosphoesterase TrpH